MKRINVNRFYELSGAEGPDIVQVSMLRLNYFVPVSTVFETKINGIYPTSVSEKDLSEINLTEKYLDACKKDLFPFEGSKGRYWSFFNNTRTNEYRVWVDKECSVIGLKTLNDLHIIQYCKNVNEFNMVYEALSYKEIEPNWEEFNQIQLPF